jgi:hypothetical protein
MFEYELCGWRLTSTFALPELAPWRGGERAPDVVVRLNESNPRQDYPIEISFLLKCSGTGRLCLTVPDIAQYHVSGGNEISIFSAPEVSLIDIRAMLFNAVLALLAHQRGLLPLHATAVRRRGRTVAFVRHASVGKSTLAATLVQRGYELLSDDITILDTMSPAPIVVPTIRRLKLWRDALEALGIPIAGLAKSRSTQEKYIYCPARQVADSESPATLERLYILNNTGLNNTGPTPMRAVASAKERLSLTALLNFMALPAVAAALGTAAAMVRTGINMLNDVQIYELAYHIDYNNVQTSVDVIEEALET